MSVLENLDDSPESIILESVLEGMSEYYSKNLGREVMKGMKESARQCRYTGGHVPYGFKVNKETYRFEIEEREAEAVRMIFSDKCLQLFVPCSLLINLLAAGPLTLVLPFCMEKGFTVDM